MSFSVDALQYRARQRSYEIKNKNKRKFQGTEHRRQEPRRDEPLVAVIGEAVKSLADTICNAIDKFWTKDTVMATAPGHDRILDDVPVEADANIVYDQNIEDGFVDVPLENQVQPVPEPSPPPLAANIGVKLPASAPIDVPKSQIRRPERTERNYI